jgi:hypothetical protein
LAQRIALVKAQTDLRASSIRITAIVLRGTAHPDAVAIRWDKARSPASSSLGKANQLPDCIALRAPLPVYENGALADLNQSAFRGNGDSFRSAHGV